MTAALTEAEVLAAADRLVAAFAATDTGIEVPGNPKEATRRPRGTRHLVRLAESAAGRAARG